MFHRKSSPFKTALKATDKEILPTRNQKKDFGIRNAETDPNSILKMDVPRGILRMGSRES